ncbi:MAG: SDR family NAD(P)-dependent oxidoreductase [Hyphomicrobium sp.]
MTTGPSPNSATPWRVVWITGASTGIGRDLALRMARDGAMVAASARSAEKLAQLVASSPNIRAFPVDVTDVSAVAATVTRIEADLGAIDLAVLNAGVWHPMTVTDYDLEKATESMSVNYVGVINAVAPLMQAMCARGAGHIALVASVAGYRGLPKGSAYGPTKSALINFAESVYPSLKAKGVKMQIVNPGFVETPMTAVNDFPMPFIVTSDEAARRIHEGLVRDKFEIVFPRRMALLMKLLRMIRYRQYFRITGRM